MAIGPAPPTSTEIARRANAHIAEMAATFDSILNDPRPIGFLCECGCLGVVEVALAEYGEADGAWIAEHR